MTIVLIRSQEYINCGGAHLKDDAQGRPYDLGRLGQWDFGGGCYKKKSFFFYLQG
jgi:hypothetical protein